MGREGKGRKSKGRKSKERKGQERKRKSEWWSENFFAIRDLIWAIYFRVEEPDPAKPSLDDLFRKLRARIDTFEAQCGNKRGHADGAQSSRLWQIRRAGEGCSHHAAQAAHVGLVKVRGRDGGASPACPLI